MTHNTFNSRLLFNFPLQTWVLWEQSWDPFLRIVKLSYAETLEKQIYYCKGIKL